MHYLAGLDQVFDGSGGVLYRCVLVDAMLVEQVDGIGAQPLERTLHDLSDVLGATVGAGPLVSILRIRLKPELRRNDDVFSKWCQSLADKLFVRVGAIHLGSVEDGDTA